MRQRDVGGYSRIATAWGGSAFAVRLSFLKLNYLVFACFVQRVLCGALKTPPVKQSNVY